MRHVLHRAILVLVLFAVLSLVIKVASPDAAASYGLGDTVETLGIATGIGAVIGLSTIAFYEKPTSHMRNALIGAGAGMIVGMGVAAYLFTESSDDDDIDPEELLLPKKTPDNKSGDQKPKEGALHKLDKRPTQYLTESGKKMSGLRRLRRKSITSVPVALALPTRSKDWAVAIRVLELGF